MNTYELTVVIPGSASAQKKNSAKEIIEKLIKVNNGEIREVKDLGKVDLAYSIKKEDVGQFLRFDLELEGEGAKAINNRLRAEEDFVRYLLIKKENTKSQETKSKQTKKSKS